MDEAEAAGAALDHDYPSRQDALVIRPIGMKPSSSNCLCRQGESQSAASMLILLLHGKHGRCPVKGAKGLCCCVRSAASVQLRFITKIVNNVKTEMIVPECAQTKGELNMSLNRH